jgi:hypothetical protein
VIFLSRVAVFFGWWLGADGVLLALWLTPSACRAAGERCGDVVGLWWLRRSVSARRRPLLAVDAELWSFAQETGAPWPAS